jgi:hypothetical protein
LLLIFLIVSFVTPFISSTTNFEGLNFLRLNYVIILLLFFFLVIYFILFSNKFSEWFSIISSVFLKKEIYSFYLIFLAWIIYSIIVFMAIINTFFFSNPSTSIFALKRDIYMYFRILANYTLFFILLSFLATSVEIVTSLLQIKKNFNI